jgi:class 3 adenylate cyclase
VSDVPWEAIEFASARTFGVPVDGDRILATVVFTDIVGSTSHLKRLGDSAWGDLLREHDKRIRSELNRFRGREIQTTGDGFLAAFDGAARAVRCAQAMSPAMTDLGITIRAGIHTGEIELIGDEARGLAVHEAARVAAVAGSGEVLVSANDQAPACRLGLDVRFRRAARAQGLGRSARAFSTRRRSVTRLTEPAGTTAPWARQPRGRRGFASATRPR